MVETEILRAFSLFRGLSQDEVQVVASACGLWETLKGQYIFKEGDKSGILYGLVEGKVMIQFSSGRLLNHTVSELTAGHIFGELALLDVENRMSAARCAEDCILFSLTTDDFRRMAKSNPGVHHKILKNLSLIISEKLRKLEMRLRENADKAKKGYTCPPEDTVI